MDFSVTTRVHDHVRVVSLEGEIDTVTAPRLGEVLDELIEGGAHHFVLDVSEVGFLDGRGLGPAFGGIERGGPHGGSMCLVAPQQPVRTVLRITDPGIGLPIYDGLEEAIPDRAPPRSVAHERVSGGSTADAARAGLGSFPGRGFRPGFATADCVHRRDIPGVVIDRAAEVTCAPAAPAHRGGVWDD